MGERLEQVEQLLGEVKSDLKSLKSENSAAREGFTPPPGDPDFCFYRKNRNIWVIRYHGQECLPQGLSSPKGMEAIRLLLSSPGVPFQPVDFDEQLKGFGYAKKDEDAAHGQPSPLHDQDNLRQLKELLDQIAEAESEMEDQPGEEQFKYWHARFRLVSALYTHEHSSPRWAMEYAKAQARIEELSIFQDDIFTTRVEALFNDQKKSPFEKYRKDAIEKSIRRALDSLYQFPDFQAYLRITIVTTHRDGFAPFVYAPDLWKGPLAPPNGWKTEP